MVTRMFPAITHLGVFGTPGARLCRSHGDRVAVGACGRTCTISAVETLTPALLLMLFSVALIAGSIDAVAGGGGLLTLPALLLAQVPPVNALATNKLQSGFGTFTSAFSMYRNGLTGGRSGSRFRLCAHCLGLRPGRPWCSLSTPRP